MMNLQQGSVYGTIKMLENSFNVVIHISWAVFAKMFFCGVVCSFRFWMDSYWRFKIVCYTTDFSITSPRLPSYVVIGCSSSTSLSHVILVKFRSLKRSNNYHAILPITIPTNMQTNILNWFYSIFFRNRGILSLKSYFSNAAQLL